MSKRKDEFLIKRLPIPTAGSVHTAAFDIYNKKTPNDIHDIHAQFEIFIPQLMTTDLPEEASLTVKMQLSDDIEFSSGVDETTVATISGAGYNGKRFTFKASEKPKRYWRGAITVTGEVGSDISDVEVDFEIVF